MKAKVDMRAELRPYACWSLAATKRVLGITSACVVIVCAGVTTASPSEAATAHHFNEGLAEALEAGVPFTAAPEEIPGPLSGVQAVAADSGHLWVGERIEKGKSVGLSRVDEFDGTSGAFIPAQLEEEDGVSELYHGVAVGHAGGEEQVYVGAAHEGKGAVAVYGPSRKLQAGGIWGGQNTPSKGFGEIRGVAIDHSANLETQGDVFVATSGVGASERVVDIYAGEAGGKEPALLAQLTGTTAGPFNDPHGVAVSPVNGDVLVADGIPSECAEGKGECVIDEFEPAPGLPGTYTFVGKIEGPEAPFVRLGPLAVDSGGDIYVADQTANVVDQLSATGELRGVLSGAGTGRFTELRSIAVEPGSGDLFVGDFEPIRKTGTVDAFGPTVIVPDVETKAAGEIKVGKEGEIEAQLNGAVNPVNEGPATCQFAYGQSASFGQTAPCGSGIPNGSSFVNAEGEAKGLAPDTSYSFRLQAENANGSNPGLASQNKTFSTPGPGIHSASAAEVTAGSAALEASIDPNNAPTSYYFQYGKSSAYEAEAPAAPGSSIGAGKGDVEVTQKLEGLDPSSVYHYRVVAVATLEVEGQPTQVSFASPDHVFTTRPQSEGPPLDERQWEMVSPQNKHGALLESISESGVIQAAASGARIAYLASQPSEEEVKGNLFESAQIFSERGEGGWSSQVISLPHAEVVPVSAGFGKEYRAFSADLCTALVEPLGEFTSLSPEAFPPDSERTPYLRHDCGCAETPSSCYEPLVTGAPGYADVPEGTHFGGNPNGVGEPRFFGEARFRGASEDLAQEILGSKVQLTSTATAGNEELYEFSAERAASERLQLVSLLPANGKGEELPAVAVHLGQEDKNVRGAISADGARVVWSGKEGEGPGHLYLRDLAKSQTVQLDTPEAACTAKEECEAGSGSPRFQLASSDGSRVLFTDTQRLTTSSSKTPGTADLYECQIEEVAGKLTCALSDLTPAPGAKQAADVQGAVLGSSTDGSWVYFVANGALVSGASQGDCAIVGGEIGEGECTLYVARAGTINAIARVSGKDYPDWTAHGGVVLNELTARVSPDGQWLAFMSQQPLSGYDNRDASSGQRDEEVYRYHAESGGEGSLSCASCNPSGARPEGVEYAKLNGQLVGGDRVWQKETWIAANVPGWDPYSLERALHQPRYLSDSGRLFFNTDDALVAADKNHDQDVYESEPAGVGSCSSALGSASSAIFEKASNSCVALISSGEAEGESAFLDASESGDDVFFLTSQALVKSDVDTALDLYDAHVCSLAAPCIEEPEAARDKVCPEECLNGPSTPPSFGSSASETFKGSGNLLNQPPPLPPHVETLHEKLTKALHACRAKYKHAKKRRVRCEAQARKRFAPKHAKKSAKTKKKSAKNKEKGKRK